MTISVMTFARQFKEWQSRKSMKPIVERITAWLEELHQTPETVVHFTLTSEIFCSPFRLIRLKPETAYKVEATFLDGTAQQTQFEILPISQDLLEV